jgi:transporter family protein
MISSISIIFGIIAMFGFGLSNAISQIPSKEIGSRRTVFFRGIFVSFLLLLILLFFLDKAVFPVKYILIAFVISFLGFIPLVTFYEALKRGKIGIISPIANSSVIFTILFSTLFFKESLSSLQILSIVLIIIGIILSSLNLKDIKDSNLFKVSSGVPHALVTCFLWGLVFFLFKIPVMALGPILSAFLNEFGILIFSGINLAISKISFSIPEKKILRYIFLVAIFGVIGTVFFNLGIAKENSSLSIVAAITFASPLVATLYGKFVYKEKLNFQQWFAIILILIGIISISYF